MLNKKLFVERLKSEGFSETAEQVLREEGEQTSPARKEAPNAYTPKTDRLMK